MCKFLLSCSLIRYRLFICAAAALGKLLQHDPGVASCMFAVMAYVAVFSNLLSLYNTVYIVGMD